MEDMLYSSVPRRIRVRGTVVVGHSRLPLRVFLIASGFGVAAALLVVLGVPLARVALLAPLCCGVLLVVEGRLAARSTREALAIGVAHLVRPPRLRLQPVVVALPAELAAAAPARPIRWAAVEAGDERR